MITLPSVTLLAADSINRPLTLRALALCQQRIRFARAVFLTDGIPADLAIPPGIDVVRIGRLDSRERYSQLMLKELLPHVQTSHVLVVQWDGYVVNPDSWSDAFLECDYIGARWFWPPAGFRVGNGGFSLRSRRLLEALQHPQIQLRGAEDSTICQAFRSSLESGPGIRFADEATADRFSFETCDPVDRPFGFHGLFNFCRVMESSEVEAVLPHLSDAIVASPQFAALLEQCLARGQNNLARTVAQRILNVRPDDAALRELVGALSKG